jgi:hypothetical protein
MPWRVKREDVDFFIEDLWKDFRHFPQTRLNSVFVKDCVHEDAARKEAAAMVLLREGVGADCVPQLLEIRGSVLVMERIRGVRLFDLIRYLKSIEDERRDGTAEKAMSCLLQRARSRLAAIQLHLQEVHPRFATEPYPVATKVLGLLDLLVRILDLKSLGEDWRRNYREFAEYWESSCCMLPFRDAISKNMIVADKRFAIQSMEEDIEAKQRRTAAQILETGDPEYWRSVRLVDFDFSTMNQLTSIEDDPISLHFHQWTFGSCPLDADHLILARTLGAPDPYRAAASFIVRYLRFGGRKLTYCLINPQGFRVRYAYDNPLFYFSKLPEICADLSPRFCSDFSSLLAVIAAIARAVESPSAAERALLSVDYLRMYYPALTRTYWQQNPYQP